MSSTTPPPWRKKTTATTSSSSSSSSAACVAAANPAVIAPGSFRSLVVVPRSHADGTTDELLRRHRAAAAPSAFSSSSPTTTTGGRSEAQKLGTIHVEFSVTSASIGGDNAWSTAVLARAVQLDLRPSAAADAAVAGKGKQPSGLGGEASLYVIWDARTIHQGHEFLGEAPDGDSDPLAGTFRPPVVRPQTFPNRGTAADRAAWLEFLAREVS